MRSLIRPTRPEGNAKPAALVVGLPWLRSGTGKVMEAQMDFFRSLGWNVLFVAVPHRERHTSEHGIWRLFTSQAQELPHFPHVVQTFPRRVRREKSLGGLRFRKKDKTALDFNFQISNSIPVSAELQSYIRDNHVQVIIGNHVYTTPFCLKLKQLCEKHWGRTHLATVTHDVQSYILIDNEVKNPWTKQQDKVEDLLRRECDMLARADALIHVSDDDLRFFSPQIGNIGHFLALPPVAGKTIDQASPDRAQSDLLFVGSNHVANLESMQWYFRSVAPCYAAEPSLTVIGTVGGLVEQHDPELWRERSAHFTGSVLDIAPFYAGARVAIAPMVSGRGISVKTIEALAYGKPVVGARFAFRGFPPQALRDHGFQFWDEPADFAGAVAAALRSPEEHTERSRRLHDALFTPDRFAASMSEVLRAASVFV